jgi:hypothetical protein
MSGDRNNFFREERVSKSRNAYTCAICRREIPAGSSYVRIRVANLGEHASHAAHDDCLAQALDHALAGSMPPTPLDSARNFAGGDA